jgi:hypothetical protein
LHVSRHNVLLQKWNALYPSLLGSLHLGDSALTTPDAIEEKKFVMLLPVPVGCATC